MTPLNVTDGSYVYMRNPQKPDVEVPLFSWMPCDMRSRWSPEKLSKATLSAPLPFSKGMPVPCFNGPPGADFPGPPKLFDLRHDPGQLQELSNPEVEKQMVGHLSTLMREAHAPTELFERFAVPAME